MKLKPKAILFDMDGVLVNSLDSWWISLNQAFVKYGKKKITKDEFISKYWGHDLKYNLEKMRLDYKILKLCNILYSQNVKRVKIYPQTIDILNRLDGYKKAIITNTPKDSTKQIIKNFNFEKYFEIVLTSDDVNYGKPNPELIIKACELLNVNPIDVVLIGDTESDVKAGYAANCKVIGIKIKADYTIQNLSEILSIIS
jgi:HAD superfamily hydrolase (TIGR01509 family)